MPNGFVYPRGVDQQATLAGLQHSVPRVRQLEAYTPVFVEGRPLHSLVYGFLDPACPPVFFPVKNVYVVDVNSVACSGDVVENRRVEGWIAG